MGMGEPRVLGAGERAMLAELRWRAERACGELGRLFSEEREYFSEEAEAIISWLDLPPDKARALREFAEKATECLGEAYEQAEARLQRLLAALEENGVKVAPSSRAMLHITLIGEEWHLHAQLRQKTWLFSLPIHGVSRDASFPDILRLPSEALYYLQAGWRASDECDDKGKPLMGTTKPWQVLAWAAARPGALHIYLGRLNLNMTKPTITWCIRANSWEQQWPGKEGKRLARRVAEQHPLGQLAWYLGDGERHKYALGYKVGNDVEYKPKGLVQEMLRAAYEAGYGVLLDLLESEKWLALKKLQPKQRPVHATFQGYTFLLNCHEDKRVLQACALFKDLEEASRLAQALAKLGVEARINTFKTRYYVLRLNGQNVLRLAELCPEWRRALKQLAQKRGLQPKTPTLRRLLELAENPPNPKSSAP